MRRSPRRRRGWTTTLPTSTGRTPTGRRSTARTWALKGPKAAGELGGTASTPAGWQSVNTAVAKAGVFHYDVDTSGIWKEGSVRLTSTGKVNDVTRTIQVRVSKGGSTDYLYYTDFEDADPGNKVPYPSGASAACGGSSNPANWKVLVADPLRLQRDHVHRG